MPRNIDDIGDDDFGFEKSAEDVALKFKMANSKLRRFSDFVEKATAQMEKVASEITLNKDLFGATNKGTEAYKKYQEDINDQLKKKIAGGQSLAKIDQDMFQIADMRLKALYKIAKEEGMTAQRRAAIEGTILKELETQQVLERNLTKSKQLYSTAVSKISGLLGGGSFSRAFESWAGKHEASITGKMATDLGKGEGFGAALNNIVGSLSKIAPVMILIGGAVAFLATRVKALLESEFALNKEIVKATGMSGGFEGNLTGRIDTAAEMLMRGLAIQRPEAREKAVAAAGGIVKAFGDLKEITATNLQLVAGLDARLGIGADEAAKLVFNLERGAGISADQIEPLFKNISSLAMRYGVGLNTVLQDVSQHAALLRLNTNGTADALARAAINARLMGTTLESQQSTARGFQTWEGAAEKAIQLTFLTGQRFNALALYTQANYGNSLGMQEQLMRQVRGVFFNKETSRIRREMLAQQLGLGSADEMLNRYSAMDAEAKITNDAISLFGKGITKDRDIDFIRAAIKMQGKGVGAEAIRSQANLIRGRADAARKSQSAIEQTLGLGELTSVTDQILGRILNSIDNVLIPAVQTIAKTVVAVAELFGIGSKSTVTAEPYDQRDTAKKAKDWFNNTIRNIGVDEKEYSQGLKETRPTEVPKLGSLPPTVIQLNVDNRKVEKIKVDTHQR